MSDTAEKTSGWRGSRGFWLEAACTALVDKGVQAVKIQLLAATLDISRTSFYWHFRDRKDLLAALVEEWTSKNTGAFLAACEAQTDTPAEAALNVISIFLDRHVFDPKLDFAMRSWALQDASIMDKVRQADEDRLAALRHMMERHGYEAIDADVRARTMYLVQTGYIAMQVEESIELRMTRIPKYVEIYTGHAPTKQELACFHKRHAFDPSTSSQ